jgi:Domain of unknown function (DUF6268)
MIRSGRQMKRIVGIIIFLLCPLLFFGEEEDISFSYWDVHPLHIGGNILRIGRAELDEGDNGHLYFRKNNAYLSLLVPINRHNYFIPKVEFNNFTLDWNKNQKFDETHFYYAQFGLTFYTNGLEDWRWILQGTYNLDLEHFSQPSLYGLFSLLIWGRYALHKKWHFHVGVLGSVGMEAAPVYPLLGLDWEPNKKWTIEVIFPITYSVQYKLNKNWRLSIKGRPLKERFRTGSHEPQPRSVFCYSSVGAEFNVEYEQFLWLDIQLFAGYDFGGTFYIKNQSGRKALYTEVGGAPYAGITVDYGF